jgi:hypothetical protein
MIWAECGAQICLYSVLNPTELRCSQITSALQCKMRLKSHQASDDSPQVLNKVHTGAMELVPGAPLLAARACGVLNMIGVPE